MIQIRLIVGCLILFVINIFIVTKVHCDIGRRIDIDDDLSRFIANNLDDYWQNMTRILQTNLWQNNQQILERFKRIIVRDNLQNQIRSECLNIIEYMIRNPIEKEWTAKIIDSGIFNRPIGLLSGTTTELGDFDQCLSIRNKFQQKKFVGRYCLATINLPRTNKFQHPIGIQNNHSQLEHEWLIDYIEQWYQNDNYYSIATAICFPSICNEREIRQLLISYYDVLRTVHFNVTYCQSNDGYDDQQPSSTDNFGLRVAWTILLTPWFLIIPATIFEMIFGDKNYSYFYKILLCFSLIKNNRYLFQIKSTKISMVGQTQQRQEFRFIHGIRAFGALFIMMAHAGGLVLVPTLMPVSVIARFPNDAIQLSRTLMAQPFYNGALVVMTFFLISGFLSTYLTASTKNLKIGFLPYVLLRWLRLTPSLIGLICLNIGLESLGNGPLFHHDLLWPTLRPCYENWWKHLLYFSNYIPVEDMCNISTWYLAADLQIHIIAFFVLILYTKNQRLAMIFCWIFVGIGMLSIIIPISIGLVKLPLIQIIMYTKYRFPNDALNFIYFACFMQFVPYFIGCSIGFVILENRLLKFTKVCLCQKLSRKLIFLLLHTQIHPT
uniref:Nose resistant to fluoxetine protein 6-like n=1 Tax=Dermatophagoides pteronyssinus TaxID=6956 RepID=A0A6P6XLT9_DERPT|nr:nose resistant to fluoxetine protein 6-like [Dermatophagoides pteronyssinus]